MGVPILVPGDAILGYTGYNLSRTSSTPLWLAYVVALAAVLGGASILFWASRRWGQKFIDSIGRFIFIEEGHIKRAEQLFARFGIWLIIVGRHVPGMRIPITIFAATSGVAYKTFLLGTFISTSLWILFYLNIGQRFGGDIQQVFRHYSILSVVIIVAIVIVIVGLHIRGLWRQRRH
jgi:membrane protein DedA with SNARE-associated domain